MVIKLRLENGSNVVDISNKLPVGYLKERGSRGFGIAPTTLTIHEGAAEGGRWRRTKRGPRDIDLPIVFQAENEQEVLALMRQLVWTLNDRFQPARLYATYPDGFEVFTEVHYAGGADHQYGEDTDGTHWARWPMTLRSPSPYWTDVDSVNYSLKVGNVGRGLIKLTAGIDTLSKLRLSSSTALGTVTVENPGDVDAYPTWEILGPGDFFHADIDGVGLMYDAAIPLNSKITINTQDKTVEDELGANRYGDLSGAPKFFTFPPGTSTVNIAMDGASASSQILFNFQPRYEVVF